MPNGKLGELINKGEKREKLGAVRKEGIQEHASGIRNICKLRTLNKGETFERISRGSSESSQLPSATLTREYHT